MEKVINSSLPLFLNKDTWLSVVSEIINTPKVWEKIRSGEDMLTQEVVLNEAEYIYNTRVPIDELFAYGDLSCPVRIDGLTPFETFLDTSYVFESCKKITCKKCSWEATQTDVLKIQRKELICCPKCGWKPGT